METSFPRLFEPGRIGLLELSNRIVKAPTSSGMSNKDDTVSDRLIRHYREQASGGVGLLIVEYAFIDEEHRYDGMQSLLAWVFSHATMILAKA